MRRGLLLLCVLLLGGVTAALAANPTPPTVTTGAASGVTTSAATVAGTINPGDAATTWRVQYGTSTGYGLTTPAKSLPAATTASNVSAALAGLTPGTTYHYRLTATNAAGVTNGGDRTFKTSAPPTKPAVSTSPATNITRDAARFNARVDPNGVATQFRFEYGLTKSLGKSTPPGDAGSGGAARSVAQLVGGLSPDTVYYFRAVATSAAGTVRGSTRSLRTTKLPLALAISASPDPVVFGTDVVISGLLSGSAVANRAITLQSRPFPFTGGFRNLGTKRVTDTAGAVRFPVAPFRSATQFRLSTSGAQSAVVTVDVQPRVRLSVRRIRGGRVRVSGLVFPSSASGRISIQRRTAGGSFVPVRRVTLVARSSGGARYRATLRYRRGLVLRAVYRGGNGGPLLGARSLVKRVPR
jgi:hypothetical protein